MLFCLKLPFFPMLLNTHQYALKRLIYFSKMNKRKLEDYETKYLKKRLERAHKLNVGESLFINDIFYWNRQTKKEEKIIYRSIPSAEVGQKDNRKLSVMPN